MSLQEKRAMLDQRASSNTVAADAPKSESAPLLSRAEYAEALARLREAHPWVGEAILRPAPGHLEPLARALRDIEEIAGLPALSGTNIAFLRAITDEYSSFAIYLDLATISPVQRSAIDDALRVARTLAKHRCAACGTRVERGWTRCTPHADERVLYQEDLVRLAPVEVDECDLYATTDLPEPEATAPDESPTAAESVDPNVPSIEVFSHADLAHLKTTAEGKDRETSARIQAIVKQMRRTSSRKALALLPADWRAVLANLKREFPNFSAFLDWAERAMALSALGDRRLSLSPALLVGPPGVGKTELVSQLADRFDTVMFFISMASAQTGADLAGSAAFWANTQPGRLFDALVFGERANPILILDEIDKISADRYDPLGPLHGLLESRTAATFQDLSVPEITLDASAVVYFATANSLENIPAPIISRFTVFEIPPPSRPQMRIIVRSMYRKLLANEPWGSAFDPELDAALVERLAGIPPRAVKQLLRAALGQAALAERRCLTADDLPPPSPETFWVPVVWAKMIPDAIH